MLLYFSNICSGDFMGRSVLHCDANKFYASVECLYHPEIRDKPVVVGGSEETRHGIVLTGNEKAKKLYGIKTGIQTLLMFTAPLIFCEKINNQQDL